jgi:hypothetical protein
MYSGTQDWINLFENIEDYWADNAGSQTLINSVGSRAYQMVNDRLLSIGIRAPVGTKAGGEYDQSLVDWESWWAIYNLLTRRHRGEWDDEEPIWASKIWWEGTQIYEDLRKRSILLEHQRSPFESGIGTPAVVATTGSAIFHTNWEGYGGYFTGTDFRQDWVVEIMGTGTANDIINGTYRWSRDGGISWLGTDGTSGTDWIHLGSHVYIRWEYQGGTEGQVEIGDKWSFSTWPMYLDVQARPEDWRTRKILIA